MTRLRLAALIAALTLARRLADQIHAAPPLTVALSIAQDTARDMRP